MSKKAVPDAWDDDDWESQADKAETAPVPAPAQEVKMSKAERLAQHAEANKKIWQSAEQPENQFFLAAQSSVPAVLKTEFKPAMKLLSRKPAQKMVQVTDPVTGLSRMTLEDEGEEEEKKDKPTAEELRLRAQRDREEKQRRYDEARARILGPKSGASTPGTTTPPMSEEGKGRGKGRGRGGRQENARPQSQSGPKELYDPHYTAKPGTPVQRHNGEATRPKDEEQIIRAPRGPDSSGRGFGHRGGRTG